MAVNFSNITNWQGFINAPNQNTGDLFWTVTFYMVYVVVVGILAFTAGLEAALLVGSVAGLVVSIFLVYNGLAAWQATIAPMVGAILFTIGYIYYSTRR